MSKTKKWNARALTAADLDRVVEIDQRIVGRSRHDFFSAIGFNLSDFCRIVVDYDQIAGRVLFGLR